MSTLRLLSVWTFACCLVACDGIDAFRTTSSELYTGQVIGSDGAEAAPSFIREGFASRTTMELTFDPVQATPHSDAGVHGLGTVQPTGTIHTFQCPPDQSTCPLSQRRQGDFDYTPLESIPRLTHDPLSLYDFPGGGRLRNYIFGARFRSTVGTRVLQRYAMIFLSLMENGRVEVRVIAPNVLDDDQATELVPALFGVFTLERHKQ